MAQSIYEKSSRDLDGSTETVNTGTKGRKAEHLWHISHNLNVSVTATFYGTHDADDDFSDSIELGQNSLTSGGDQKFETMSDPWEQIRIELSYGGNPSSGSITVYENAER